MSLSLVVYGTFLLLIGTGISEAPATGSSANTDEFYEQTKDVIPLQPESSLADYRLSRRPIGTGSIGMVYKAKNLKQPSQPSKAMKRIDKHNPHIVSNIMKVKQEVILLKLFQNSMSILKMEQVFQTPKEVIIVSELASLNLGDAVDALQQYCVVSSAEVKRRITLQVFTYTALSLAMALRSLRTKQVIHGDLKPENVLVFSDGKVKLADFTDSNFYANRALMKAGASEVMPSEALKSPPEISYSTDIWSMGAVLYFVASNGRTFFRDHTLSQYEANPVINLPLLTPQANAYLRALLEPEPSKRLGVNNVRDLLMHPMFSDPLTKPFVVPFTGESPWKELILE